MKLNDTKCKNAKPLDAPAKSPRKLADGDGLYLWVYPNGAKRWRFDYRLNGERKVLSIGIYPEISLKEAREKKVEARKLVAEGNHSKEFWAYLSAQMPDYETKKKWLEDRNPFYNL